MKVDESNFSTFEKVEKITNYDSNIVWTDAENIKGYINAEDMFYMIEDLILEIECLKEQYRDLEIDLRENYTPIPFNPYDEYGVSERDFH